MSAARDPTRESLSAELGSSALSCPFVARDIVREVDRERKDSVHAAWVRFESGEMTREQLEIILSHNKETKRSIARTAGLQRKSVAARFEAWAAERRGASGERPIAPSIEHALAPLANEPGGDDDDGDLRRRLQQRASAIRQVDRRRLRDPQFDSWMTERLS